ncbi:hypothetical protein D3C72_1627230 [compost metagenome]
MPVQHDSLVKVCEPFRVDDLETVEAELAPARQGGVGATVDQQVLGAQGLAEGAGGRGLALEGVAEGHGVLRQLAGLIAVEQGRSLFA